MRRPLTALLLFASAAGRTATVITNEGSAIFGDDAVLAQPPVVASAGYTVKTNPVIRVWKSVFPSSAARGMPVTYTLTVAYTQTGAGCGDDSLARNVFVFDTIPAGLTYVPMSASLSGDGGLTFSLLTATNFDAARRAVTVPLGTLGECSTGTSPACGAGGCARVVKFSVTVN